MQGADSLACMCETDSEYYNALRCDPANYSKTVNVSSDPLLYTPRRYNVHVPKDYTFSDGFCAEVRFDPDYRPAFVSSQNLAYIRQGMRFAVTGGTAKTANLPYINVAGKTGTA